MPALAVGERVEERQADRVRFRAGAERAGDPRLGCASELDVGVMPQLTRVRVETQPAGGAGVLDRAREHARQTAAGERVAGFAFGQQPSAPAADHQKPVRQPVSELKCGEVITQLAGRDVPNDSDVSVGRAGGRSARHELPRPAGPRRAQRRRQRRVIARGRLQRAGEL